ncbi:MAG: hypothetical protein A2Y10_09485 [Planctomycetes bacterium GWF2_41_51]|nr:MAG: hypothetical protein A2Y10_09485 [Planctomycetes bacterium GWF2_41_51]
MKKNLQVKKSAFTAFLLASFCVFINISNAGVLNFKMTAPKTTLQLGEEVTVSVSAWVNDTLASPDNGLDTWQVDLSVSQTGIVEITKTGNVANILLLAPNPDTMWSGWNSSSVNNPSTGEVRSVAVLQSDVGAPSTVGVGGYTDIFTFTIRALSLGTLTYNICDNGGGGFFGILAEGEEFDNDVIDAGDVVFDSQNSDATFTVIPVPEPASLAIFAFAGLLSFLRKK